MVLFWFHLVLLLPILLFSFFFSQSSHACNLHSRSSCRIASQGGTLSSYLRIACNRRNGQDMACSTHCSRERYLVICFLRFPFSIPAVSSPSHAVPLKLTFSFWPSCILYEPPFLFMSCHCFSSLISPNTIPILLWFISSAFLIMIHLPPRFVCLSAFITTTAAALFVRGLGLYLKMLCFYGESVSYTIFRSFSDLVRCEDFPFRSATASTRTHLSKLNLFFCLHYCMIR